LPRYRTTGNALGAVGCLEGLAAVIDQAGQHARAVSLFGAMQAQRGALGTPLALTERAWVDSTLAAARSTLGEVAFMQAWAAGVALSLEQACDLASTKQSG
jgi:hypothetical protein